MASQNLKFAAFDLDGTLIDSANSIVAGVLACWEACGFPLPEPEDVRRIIGLPWEESVQALLPGAGETEFAMIRTYHEEVRRGERTRPARSEQPFPGIHELLHDLETADYLLGIVTSRSSHRLTELLEENGFSGRFLTLKTADMGPGKPNPHLLLEAMSDLGVERDETVMIGDTTFDVQMANNAGATSVGVSWGVHPVEELSAAGADHIVHDIEALSGVIERVFDGR